MVFSGIKLEPVAFSLGMPLAKRPPRPSGAPPPPPPPFPPVLLAPLPTLEPPFEGGATEPRLGLSNQKQKKKLANCERKIDAQE